MTTTNTLHITHHESRSGRSDLLLLTIGLIAMYTPTYITLDQTIWKIVGQGHGPVMLALTLWLIWQRLPKFFALESQPRHLVGMISLAIGLAAYVIGRSQDILLMDTGSQIFILSGLVLIYRGWAGLRLMWFPIFFLIFIIPIPGSVVDQITAPLKTGVSYVSENLLYMLGYPVARLGVTLTIGQYQLLVADACAGLNSIFALEAIGIFYLSIAQHTNKLRSVVLAFCILPISFVSNVIRVCSLVLITYYFGDEVGQGFVHEFAGLLLFMLATAFTIGLDSILGLFFKEKPAIQAVEPQATHTTSQKP